mmetsp:Transcript_36439/g.79352  ORF Transcript_36439/g.79352 Transcript_36439/m.79352 type:complete len:169 (-) Transcript_36439:2485-2991(-)
MFINKQIATLLLVSASVAAIVGTVDAASTTATTDTDGNKLNHRRNRPLRGIIGRDVDSSSAAQVGGTQVDIDSILVENAKFWDRALMGGGGSLGGSKKKKSSKKKAGGKGKGKGKKAGGKRDGDGNNDGPDIDRRVGSNDAGQHNKKEGQTEDAAPETETFSPPPADA